jgi:hypothetical protein
MTAYVMKERQSLYPMVEIGAFLLPLEPEGVPTIGNAHVVFKKLRVSITLRFMHPKPKLC